MKVRSTQFGSIELLLLLSCMVGVVVFLCFTLVIVSLEETHDNGDEAALGYYRALARQLHELESEAGTVQSRIYDLSNNLVAQQDKLNSYNILRKKLSGYEQSAADIQQKIADLRAELLRQKVASDGPLQKHRQHTYAQAVVEQKKQSQMKKRYWKQITELDHSIDQTQAELEKIKKTVADRSSIQHKQKLASLWNGNGRFKHPLVVECIKDGVKLHPTKRFIASNKIRSFAFKASTGKYDAIVLLVRPNGYDSFNRSYFRITELSKIISYEPIGNDVAIHVVDEQ